MKRALEWSYELLSESERTLFRRFSVFAGGWTPRSWRRRGRGIVSQKAETLQASSRGSGITLGSKPSEGAGRGEENEAGPSSPSGRTAGNKISGVREDGASGGESHAWTPPGAGRGG